MFKTVMKRIMESEHFAKISYSVFFLLLFVIYFYRTFPTDSLKERIIYEIESRTPYKAEIADISVYPIFSLKVHDLRLSKPNEAPINIEQLNLSPSVIRLIFSDRVKLPFKAYLMGGEGKGTLVYNLDTRHVEKVEARLADLNIDKVPAMITGNSNSDATQAQGTMSGEFSVELNPQPKGQFDFQIEKLGISNLVVQQFPLPGLSGLQTSFKGSIENQLTKIEKLEFKGDDLHLLLSGNAPILWKIKKGDKIDLGLKLLITGKKLAFIKTFLASHLSPQGDGSLGGKIAGTVGSPKVVKGSPGIHPGSL